jgi:hypothetical protein
MASRTLGRAGVDLDQVVAALVSCWKHGDVGGLEFWMEPGEDLRALIRPAMTLARVELRERLEPEPPLSPGPGGAGSTRPAAATPASGSCS